MREENMQIQIVVMANSMVYPELISGGDKLFIEISKHLDATKYKIRVITTNIGYEIWVKSGTKAEIIKLPSSFFDRLAKPALVPFMYLVRALRACRIPLSSSKPTIVYSSSDFIPDVFPALWMKIRKGNVRWIARIYHVIPPPIRRRGNFILSTLSFLGQRVSFWVIKRKADLIIVLNESLYNELIKLGFPKERMAISGGGIDFQRIDSVQPMDKKRYDGVFLGRLHPNKGIYDLIEIWKRVVDNKKDAKLAIIGGGSKDMIRSINERIYRYNLQANIDLLGFIPDDQKVYEILKSSKIFLFTDHENGWSLATCEAMACRLPVVAYNLEIFGTVFKQGFVTVPLYHIEEFSREVLNLLRNDKKRSELAEKAYQHARSFDWRETAKNFSCLIEKVLK